MIQLRALRPHYVASLERAVDVDEIFQVDDKVEVADLVNAGAAAFVQEDDRDRFVRRDRAVWLPLGDRERMPLDQDFVEAAKIDMQRPATREGYVHRWKPRRRFSLFGINF